MRKHPMSEYVTKLICIIRIITDEREEQLNQRDAQLFREQKACLEQLRLVEEQGEQMEASLQNRQTQIKIRLGMQNETLQKEQERLENQIKANQEREKSVSCRLEDWGKQLDKKEVTLRNQDSELKRRKILLKSQARQREREHNNAVDELQARVDTFEKADEEFRRPKSQHARLGIVANSQMLQAKDSELATLKQKVQELENSVFLFEQHGGKMLLGEEGEELLNDERGFNSEEAEEQIS
jgi:chromosome segregation ATPase